MAEIKQLFQVTSLPGIKRDGTDLDGDQFTDGQWVRFQRGRPKKMGGYQQVTPRLDGPIRACRVWSRASMNAVYTFSPAKVEMVLVDSNGLGSSIIDRTPAGFTVADTHLWSTDTLYNAGGTSTALLAHPSTALANIDDTTVALCYYGDISANTALTSVGAIGPAGTGVSGGVFSVAPYAFFMSSDGYLQWCDANQPTVLTSGDASSGRITGAKLVKGLPLRSGSGPAALIWSLDSVLRMDYSGGSTLFKFTHITTQSSILAQNSVIEYDGLYYWLGIDRFLVSDGSSMKELPNQMNLNWFFDNLNYEQRQKVWAMKVPRYGEIHWYFPYGDAEECTNCVIYNVREQTWYDNELARSAGFYSQVFKYPVMADPTQSASEIAITLSGVAGTFAVNDQVLGDISGAIGTIVDKIGSTYYIHLALPNVTLVDAEGLTDQTSGATGTIDTLTELYSLHLHEKGRDAVVGDFTNAINSNFTTADFGLPTGGAKQNDITGLNRWTRVVRVEPDFLMEGSMTVEVLGREFAAATETATAPETFDGSTEKLDLRAQAREIRLKFTSNEVGGHYEMGRVILHTEPGDVRS